MRMALGLVIVVAACVAACSDAADQVVDHDAATADGAPSVDASVDAASPDAAVRLNSPGKDVRALIVDGERRETIVYIPEKARTTRPPVVFMFHGTSGSGERFYEISGWKEKADEVGMIVLFPTAMVHCFWEDENQDGDVADPGERKVTTKWSSGHLGGDADSILRLCTPEEIAQLPEPQRVLANHAQADDLEFFDAMLAMLEDEYEVDERRIYVTGFSNGGQMTSRIAVERSDKVAAGAAAGASLGVDTVAARPMPFVYSIGAQDDRFTTRAGVAPLPLTDELLVEVPFVGALVVRYCDALSLEREFHYGDSTAGGGKLIQFEFRKSMPGAPAGGRLLAVFIEGLAHEYPNGTNHPVSAAHLLWAFFEPHSLP